MTLNCQIKLLAKIKPDSSISGCGGIDAPWFITLPTGVRVNFTLWDFDVKIQGNILGDAGNGAVSEMTSPCRVYAIIKVIPCLFLLETSYA